MENSFYFNLNFLLFFQKELIPYGCRKVNYYSNNYIQSFACNLLGLSENVDQEDLMYHLEGKEEGGECCSQKEKKNNKEFKVFIKIDTKDLSPQKEKTFDELKQKTRILMTIHPSIEKCPPNESWKLILIKFKIILFSLSFSLRFT